MSWPGPTAALEVIRPGPLALVEDLGRPGLAAMGVGRSGAADRAALVAANRLLGNVPAAAAVETTLGGLAVTVRGAGVTFAVTGAEVALTVDGKTRPMRSVERILPGSTLVMGVPGRGLRSYLAVRGGIDTAPVLGSRSTDVLSGLGPPRLEPGTMLPIGTEWEAFPLVDQLPLLVGMPVGTPGAEPAGSVALRVVRGPRDTWVADVDALVGTTWRVGTASNRVGVRLTGTALTRADGAVTGELPSEGVYRGAVQVPPSGEPVVFLADHPITGGYPVVGVVVDEDVDRAAQLRPGDPVTFRWTA